MVPILFIIDQVHILPATEFSKCGVKTHPATVQDLDFDDDIVLLDPNSTTATGPPRQNGSIVGFNNNFQKTKAMYIC